MVVVVVDDAAAVAVAVAVVVMFAFTLGGTTLLHWKISYRCQSLDHRTGFALVLELAEC